MNNATAMKSSRIADRRAGGAACRATHLAAAACMVLAGCAGPQGETAMVDGTHLTGAAGGRNTAVQNLRGVVQQIEWVPARKADIAVSGAMGAAAAGGTVPGMESPEGYRVTLRADDGSTQTVFVGLQPECNVGDRVTYSNGSVARQ